MNVLQDPTPTAAAPAAECAVASPACVAAAAIARAAGVTMAGEGPPASTATPGAGSPRGEQPTAAAASPSCCPPKVGVDEKENIDPVTGLHARLASGAAAGCAATSGTFAISNARASLLFCFQKMQTTCASFPRTFKKITFNPSLSPSLLLNRWW
jgi:hypothetical protein